MKNRSSLFLISLRFVKLELNLAKDSKIILEVEKGLSK